MADDIVEKVPETFKGIKVSDKLLGEPTIPKKVKIHDDVVLDEEQIEALDVLPKDTFYSNITMKDADNQTEACFGKMRWRDKAKDDNDEHMKVFDSATNTLNLANKKATEMKSNQRVKMVDPDCNDVKEIKMDNLKVEIKNIYADYIDNLCTREGEIKKEFIGEHGKSIKVLKSIKQKVIDKEIVALPTDKTNKVSVMKSNTYLESMKEHHNGDKIINKKELNKVERKLGYHSKSVVKIFKVGQSHGQHKRALNNATVHVNGQIPVMKGSEKDHKTSETSITRPRVYSCAQSQIANKPTI